MKKLFTLFFCFMLLHGLIAQPGTLDLNFNPGDLGFGHGDGADEWIGAMVELPDGKILIGGAFTTYNGIARNRIARLYPDGSLDHTFDPGSGFDGYFSSTGVYAINLLENGKILVAGYFSQYNNQAANSLVRLHPDGSLDTEFDAGAGTDQRIHTIALQADGKILIGGIFTSYDGHSAGKMARIHSDGSFDDSFSAHFDAPVTAFLAQEDGKIMVGGRFRYVDSTDNHRIVRLMPDGSLDESFNANFSSQPFYWGFEDPFISEIHLTGDNKYLLAGRLHISNWDTIFGIMRFHYDGSIDQDFSIPYMAPAPGFNFTPYINALYPLQSGHFLISGGFSSYNGVATNGFAMIDSECLLVSSFEKNFSEAFLSFVEQENGKIVIAGGINHFDNIRTSQNIIRINPDFSLDLSFNSGTAANHHVYSSVVQDDQKIIIAGRFHQYDGVMRKGIARLHPDGSLDQTFDPVSGLNHSMETIFTVAIQNESKVLAGGQFIGFDNHTASHLVRLNSDGSVDYSFDIGSGAGSAVRDIKTYDDGRILVAGAFQTFNGQPARRIVRLNNDGSVDEDFDAGEGANGTILSVAVQPDGKILVGGSFTMFNNVIRNRIARLNHDGSLDLDFDPGAGVGSGHVKEIRLQPDGKILIGGLFLMVDNFPRNGLARLNSDGSVDTGFELPELPGIRVEDLILDQNQKIVIGGMFSLTGDDLLECIARFQPDGSLDTTFQMGLGFNHFVQTLSLQADGHIIAGGWFTAFNGIGRNRVARIIGDEAVGIKQPEKAGKWRVFPNPSMGNVTLQSEQMAKNATLRLYDLQGRAIIEKSRLSGKQFNLDISPAPSGIYILEIRDSDWIEQIKIIRSK